MVVIKREREREREIKGFSGGRGSPQRAAMPNGHREPYRIRHGESPSPCHTSNSEETWINKMRYRFLARKVLFRFRLNIKLMRRERRIVMVMMISRIGMHMSVVRLIGEFID